MKSLRVVLATGGTGGHIFPAEALAEVLHAAGHTPVILADARFQHYATASKSLQSYETHILPSVAICGSALAKIGALAKNIAAFASALRIMRRIKPDAVVGFGGYPSLPTMLAAQFIRLPTILHEQNALLGKTNAIIAKRSRAIATSFPVTTGINPSLLRRLSVVGNPVRAAIRALRDTHYHAATENDSFELLVTGGSQGAAILAQIVPNALALLNKAQRSRIRLTQQVRPEQLEELRNHYAVLEIDAELSSFFCDIPERLKTAHLVIARAGASTVAELTCAGRPAILVPLPHAAQDHQTINAQAFADAGAGWMVAQPLFTAQTLAQRLDELLKYPNLMNDAAACAHRMGQPDAAHLLMQCTLKVINHEILE